jgi:hypothetical protein
MVTTLAAQTRPKRLRVMLWFCERDAVYTDWLHVELTDAEVERIQAFAWLCHSLGIPLEFAVGPLWEARWLDADFYPHTGPIPDNPYKKVEELFAALQSSVWRLLFTGKGLPSGTIIDLWNECLENSQKPILKLWYPWAKSALKEEANGIKADCRSAVSFIIPEDGSVARAVDGLQWFADLGCGLPEIIELHVNDVPDEKMNANVVNIRRTLRMLYPDCRITIGEDDVDRKPGACAQWLSELGPDEYLGWQD